MEFPCQTGDDQHDEKNAQHGARPRDLPARSRWPRQSPGRGRRRARRDPAIGGEGNDRNDPYSESSRLREGTHDGPDSPQRADLPPARHFRARDEPRGAAGRGEAPAARCPTYPPRAPSSASRPPTSSDDASHISTTSPHRMRRERLSEPITRARDRPPRTREVRRVVSRKVATPGSAPGSPPLHPPRSCRDACPTSYTGVAEHYGNGGGGATSGNEAHVVHRGKSAERGPFEQNTGLTRKGIGRVSSCGLPLVTARPGRHGRPPRARAASDNEGAMRGKRR